MRLSLMLPPDSLMTRVSSWTMPGAVAADRRNGQVLLHL